MIFTAYCWVIIGTFFHYTIVIANIWILGLIGSRMSLELPNSAEPMRLIYTCLVVCTRTVRHRQCYPQCPRPARPDDTYISQETTLFSLLLHLLTPCLRQRPYLCKKLSIFVSKSTHDTEFCVRSVSICISYE